MFALYTLLYSLGLCLLAPRALWHRISGGRYGIALGERLGRVPDRLLEARDCVWIHSVSVGEVHAARGLIPHLRRRLPSTPIVLSTTTPTGQTLAQVAGADATCYMPLDLPMAVHAFLHVLRPRAMLLVETEIWPNLLRACARRHVPIALVNARLSERSCRRYTRLGSVWRRPFELIDLVCARTPLEAERFARVGIEPRRIFVTGNLKGDAEAMRPPESVREELRAALGLDGSGRWLVAGCTMDNEEPKVLRAFRRVRGRYADTRLLLAPRHPERFDEVAALVESAGFRCARRTRGPVGDADVALLDTIGELPAAYGLGDVAFVGGSLVPTGGHNLLEPAIQSRPVVIGPHTHNFAALAADLEHAGGALRVADAEALGNAVIAILDDPSRAETMGRRAREVALRDARAGARTAGVLVGRLSLER